MSRMMTKKFNIEVNNNTYKSVAKIEPKKFIKNIPKG